MNIENIENIASLIIAFIALIVSIISMNKANKFGATADRLNKMLIEREETERVDLKMADLSASVFKSGSIDYRLKIYNCGKGTARDVKLIDLDSENSPLLADDIRCKFPIPIFERHQSVDVIAAPSYNTNRTLNIKLQWKDEAGNDHEKNLTPVI